MKLEAILSGDPALLYMERYVDEGAKRYSRFAARTEAAPQYRPQSNNPSFELVTVHVPKHHVFIVQADPSASLLESYAHADDVFFAVHPETWMSEVERLDELRNLPKGKPIRVAPTASTRTVLVLERRSDVPAHFLKLHYPRFISRFNRRLRRKNIHTSIAVSRDVAHISFGKFAYLADSFGFTLGNEPTSWGFLVREAVPRPFRDDTRFLIPCFALYAGDRNHPEDPPLLVQLIDRLGADPISFAVEQIMIPVVECWAEMARQRGILLESHAQNTLLEIDRDFNPCRIVHRDFDVWIDRDVRHRAGLEVPPAVAAIGSDDDHPVDQRYSLIYDRFIGHEFFDCLLEVLERFYTADANFIKSSVRAAFHRAFPEAALFFPANTMFYFSDDPAPDNKYKLVDMKKTPEWR